MTSQLDIELEELEQLTLQCSNLIDFLSSPAFHQPLHNFIEDNCYLFSDSLLEQTTTSDPTSSSADSSTAAVLELLKQRKLLYKQYKKRLNRSIWMFMNKELIQRDLLAEVMTGSFQGQVNDQTRQLLLAVEDLEMFTFFMQDFCSKLYATTNDNNNNSTSTLQPSSKFIAAPSDYSSFLNQTQGPQPTFKEQYDTAVEESLRLEQRREQHRLTLKEQEDALLDQMMKLSQREEDERRRRREWEEEEMLRKAMEESEREEEERRRLLMLRQQKSQVIESKQEDKLIQKEEVKEESKVKVDQVQKGTFKSEKTLNALKLQQHAKVQPIFNQPESLPSISSNTNITTLPILEPTVVYDRESFEERQRRLKIQRDLLRNKLNQNKEKTKDTNDSKTSSGLGTEEEKKRMNRCLNVLREAATQMFKGKDQSDLNDINYYDNLEEEKDSSDEEQSLIFLNKGKKDKKQQGLIKKQQQQLQESQQRQVIELDLDDDDL